MIITPSAVVKHASAIYEKEIGREYGKDIGRKKGKVK
jgi:hypothetical protein